MTPFVPMALYGWLLVGPLLFWMLRARVAVIAVFALGWMLLPMHTYDVAGLPPFGKTASVSYAALLGAILFDHRSLTRFRPALIDLPMLAWCLVPFFSVMANGPFNPAGAPEPQYWDMTRLGVYEALSATWEQTIAWGVPYLLGRCYFSTRESHRDACVALLVAGACYIPFCLYEMRMSPQLHRLVYGFHQHDFLQTYRFGGFRPMVFMEHGLMVAFWMTAAAIAGWQLWISGLLRRAWGVSMLWVLVPLTLTAVGCRSLGAWAQLVLGLATIWVVRRFRAPVLIAILALAPPGYVVARTALGWGGGHVTELVATVSQERAQSFHFRVVNETRLAEHAMKRPILGWAGWKRNRVYDEQGKDISVTDGQWVLALGLYGIVGLTALFGWLLIPATLALLRLQSERARLDESGCSVALALLAVLFALDAVPNAMLNPVFVLLIGGLGTFAIVRPVRAPTMPRRGEALP